MKNDLTPRKSQNQSFGFILALMIVVSVDNLPYSTITVIGLTIHIEQEI
jgi:hypothetical protein